MISPICKVILVSSLAFFAEAQSSDAAFLPHSTTTRSTTSNTNNARVGAFSNTPKSTLPIGTFQKVRQIQGASPTLATNAFPLFAKKKKKDSSAPKGGKIQVKLLKHIAGTGSAGDVIMVAPAFFANKLQKTGSAVRISDEEVQKENAKKVQKESEEAAQANGLKEKIDGLTLTLVKKAGPDGKLFGGINYKTLIDELQKDFPKGSFDAKYIKITAVKGDDGKSLKHDIKTLGEYSATISLLKGISADFKVLVTNDN